jgi:hypothetical protein
VFFTLALTPALSGCFSWERSTVTLRDPAEVRLARDWSADPGEVLPPGRDPQTAAVTAGTFDTGAGARTAYHVDAVREPDAGMSLRVGAGVAMLNGEQHVLVSSGGVFVQTGHPLRDLISEDVLQGADLRLPRCLSVSRSYSYDDDFLGYRADVASRCAPGVLSVPVRLETPWSNVREIRHVKTPQRQGALIAMAVTTAALVLPGAILAGLHAGASSRDGAGSSTVGALGWTLVAVGGGFDLAFLPTAVAPTETTVLRPGDGLPE